MNYIEPKEGTMYNPAHLRPFDLELAKQGHPLAWDDGSEVSHIFQNSKDAFVIRSFGEYKNWDMSKPILEVELKKYLRLAPLDVKDGKPLHVGDVIEENYSQPLGEEPSCELPIWTSPKPAYVGLQYEWRWPVEVKG